MLIQLNADVMSYNTLSRVGALHTDESFQHFSDCMMEEVPTLCNVLTLSNVSKAFATKMQLQLFNAVKYQIYLANTAPG